MLITNVRHDWPEAEGFRLIRPKGYPEYTFIHFLTPVILEIKNRNISVNAGGCIIYPPGMPQSFTAQGPLVHNWFHALPAVEALFAQYELPVGKLFYPNYTEFISDHFYKMELEHFSENSYKADLSDAYLQEFLICLSRAIRQSAPIAAARHDDNLAFKMARQYILSHPEKKWTVAQMATLVSLSASRFHAIYKALYGTSPMHDLIDVRIDSAKSLLLSHERLPLSQIAEQMGYNDQYHFIRQFRDKAGMTPNTYRKMNKKTS